MTIENEEISKLILAAREAMASDTDKNKISEAVNALRAVTIHYAEKGDLFQKMHQKCSFANRVLIFTPDVCRQTI